MNEATKTAIFLALALVFFGAAIMSRPVVPEIKMDEMVGKPLFPKFTGPLAVKKLDIIRPDAEGSMEEFSIAEVNGIWSIPSHDNYPADAEDQMGRVTEALVDLNVVGIAAELEAITDATSLHIMYGLVDPTAANASTGEGIGIKVTVKGTGDETLVDLIVGKKVDTTTRGRNPMSEESGGSLYYVRITDQLPVYEVSIDPTRFTTTFDRWIEKNLLDISAYDIKEVFIDEYSLKVERGMMSQMSLIPTFTGDLTLSYDSNTSGEEKWRLKKWMGFGKKHDYYERTMKPDQGLNAETLDEMVRALNDLKIVDVMKKPVALAGALAKGESFDSIQPDPSLMDCGFYLVPMPDLKGGTTKKIKQLLSNEGDIQLRMKDGVRYTLRFGDLTGTESEIDAENKEKEVAPTMGANRYLFITADFDSSLIAAPDVKEVPSVPADGDEDMIKMAQAERERTEKSNQREQQRFDEQVAAGKKRTETLSRRFADWFYVIPEDVYKKIHLTEANMFKEIQIPTEQEGKGENTDETNSPTQDMLDLSSLPSLPEFGTIANLPEESEAASDSVADATEKGTEEKDATEKDKAEKDAEKQKPDETEKVKNKPNDSEQEPLETNENQKNEENQEGDQEEKKGDAFDPFGGLNPSK